MPVTYCISGAIFTVGGVLMNYFFEKGKFTEDQLEQAIIELFQLQGYTYVHGENIHRQYEDILLEDDLRSFLLDR